MKVFISSTVFDLIDARNEIFHFLTDSGCEVLLSEIPESSFGLSGDKSSIETCLINVRQSNYFVLIVDRRYGPSLKDYGYEDVSATHLEYREAVKNNIPIIAFIRDKTLSEYSIFKKNRDSFKGIYIDDRNQRIFDLIEEHSKLESKEKNNWLTPFATSFDLRRNISKSLRIPFLKETLAQKIAEGYIPLLKVSQNVMDMNPHGVPFKMNITVTIRNNSKSAAFILRFAWSETEERDEGAKMKVLLPGEAMERVLIWSGGAVDKLLIVEYASHEGIYISETHRVQASVTSLSPLETISGLEQQERKFKVGEPIEFGIEE